jgi:hypothetical protein
MHPAFQDAILVGRSISSTVINGDDPTKFDPTHVSRLTGRG